jgi:hypothetical protein
MSGAKPAWEIRDEPQERELPPVARLQLIKYDRGEDAVASGAVGFLVYGSKASTANYGKIERGSR